MNREVLVPCSIPCSIPFSYSHQAESVADTSFVFGDALHAFSSFCNTSSPHGPSGHWAADAFMVLLSPAGCPVHLFLGSALDSGFNVTLFPSKIPPHTHPLPFSLKTLSNNSSYWNADCKCLCLMREIHVLI